MAVDVDSLPSSFTMGGAGSLGSPDPMAHDLSSNLDRDLNGQKTESLAPTDNFFYPREIENDLRGVDLPDKFIVETLACAWEYARCVIPQYTNWSRYLAFIRII